jgi:hypothetical protein
MVGLGRVKRSSFWFYHLGEIENIYKKVFVKPINFSDRYWPSE